MSRIKNRMKISSEKCDLGVDKNKEYDYQKNLNWRDDGNAVTDPSMNDFLKGYQIEPYEFKQWASKKNLKMKKKADMETVVMQFTPEFLADRILTLWNGVDGQLQNFFEGFTLRYDNKLKLAIADILASKGHKVLPVLTDDKPRYARHQSIFRKIVASKDITNILDYGKMAFKESEGLRLLAGEIDDLKESGYEVSKDEVSGLLDYYLQIFPEDFAIALVTIMVDKPEESDNAFEQFKDYNLQDETLDRMEDMMSGNADPMYRKDGGVGGYDFTSDSRHDTTAPGSYELRASQKKN